MAEKGNAEKQRKDKDDVLHAQTKESAIIGSIDPDIIDSNTSEGFGKVTWHCNFVIGVNTSAEIAVRINMKN